MERISSRQNRVVQHLRRLGTDRVYRSETREFVCSGEKLLGEALKWGAEISCVICSWELGGQIPAPTYLAPEELVDYASPMKNSQGIVFACRMPEAAEALPRGRAVVLERLQDPGNVGTVIRTANAFGVESVVLVDCADLYNPKTVRATMGAVFRQRIVETGLGGLEALLAEADMELYAAALTGECVDVRELPRENIAVAIGNEGAGLSDGLTKLALRGVRIPMSEQCESLNAAVAAAVIMWEISR